MGEDSNPVVQGKGGISWGWRIQVAMICPVTLDLSGLSSILGNEQVSKWAPSKSSCLVSLVQRPCLMAACGHSNAFLQLVSPT